MRRLIPHPLRATAGKARDARAERRRSQRRRQLGRLALKVGLPALLLGVAAGSGTWAWRSGWLSHQADRAAAAAVRGSAELGLELQDVRVSGRTRTAPEAILGALGVAHGGPILALDPMAVKRRLEALPWVKHATVARLLPQRVRIDLVERVPTALWQLDGQLAVIDRDGRRIDGIDPQRYARLPLVVGPGANAHARELLALLRQQDTLERRVKAAVRVRERRWNVVLRNGVEVQLPADSPQRAWARLADIERKHGVLQRDVQMIDLRLPDRMVVRMAPGSKPMSEAPELGEST